MLRLDGLKLNDGKLMLKRVSSLSPSERVEFLVNAQEDAQLTPVSPSYLAMGFPSGVFTRAFEERHYLDMIMCEAAISHETKKLFENPRLEDLARGYSVPDEAERQQQQHDDMMRGALGKVGFEEYQKQNSVLYNGVGLYSGHTVLDEIERQNVYGLGATNAVQNEIERLQAGSDNSFLGGGAVGSAFEEMERLREESENSLGLGAAGSAFEEMERLRTEAGNSLGFGVAGSAFEEMESLRKESENRLGFGAAGSAFEEMERLRAEAGNSLGFGVAGSAFEEMERLRKESENRLGFGAAGSAFDEMILQRAEFDNSLGTYTAQGALEAMEKQQKEFERNLRAGDAGGALENAIREQMDLSINPFNSLIHKELDRDEDEGFQAPIKKNTFDLPPPVIPPLPKFEPPKLDKTDEVKEEEHRKHVEMLAAGQKLYDLQLQAKNEQSERLNSLLEAQDRIVAVQERIVNVQERMEKSSEKTDRKMFRLGMATLLAALAALFIPFLAWLDISWGDYFSWFPEFIGWFTEAVKGMAKDFWSLIMNNIP